MSNQIGKAQAINLQNPKSLFETLFREEQLECDWEEKGVLLVFKTQSEMQKSERNRILKAETTHGDYTADDYVLTTGAWPPQITRGLGLKSSPAVSLILIRRRLVSIDFNT